MLRFHNAQADGVFFRIPVWPRPDLRYTIALAAGPCSHSEMLALSLWFRENFGFPGKVSSSPHVPPQLH